MFLFTNSKKTNGLHACIKRLLADPFDFSHHHHQARLPGLPNSLWKLGWGIILYCRAPVWLLPRSAKKKEARRVIMSGRLEASGRVSLSWALCFMYGGERSWGLMVGGGGKKLWWWWWSGSVLFCNFALISVSCKLEWIVVKIAAIGGTGGDRGGGISGRWWHRYWRWWD